MLNLRKSANFHCPLSTVLKERKETEEDLVLEIPFTRKHDNSRINGYPVPMVNFI